MTHNAASVWGKPGVNGSRAYFVWSRWESAWMRSCVKRYSCINCAHDLDPLQICEESVPTRRSNVFVCQISLMACGVNVGIHSQPFSILTCLTHNIPGGPWPILPL